MPSADAVRPRSDLLSVDMAFDAPLPLTRMFSKPPTAHAGPGPGEAGLERGRVGMVRLLPLLALLALLPLLPLSMAASAKGVMSWLVAAIFTAIPLPTAAGAPATPAWLLPFGGAVGLMSG